MRTAVFAAAFLATASPAIADNYETGRRIYAIGEAAQEFCPGVTVSFSAALALKQAFGYAPTASEPEFSRAMELKQQFLRAMRSAGNRQAACDLVMHEFGPGAPVPYLSYE